MKEPKMEPVIIEMPDAGTVPEVPGAVEQNDSPLKVKYIEGKDWPALIFNIVSALMIIIIVGALIATKTSNLFAIISFPLCVVWVIGVGIRDRLWATVEAQEAITYVDKFFSSAIIAYTQGGHFTRWSSDRQEIRLSFLRFQEIKATRDSKSPIRAVSADGYDIEADVRIFFRYCSGHEALTRSLKYKPEEIQALILARVSESFSNICGKYDYDVLVANKARLALLIANIFAGENKQSPFEKNTGVEIKNPALLDFGLTAESRAIYDTRAKAKAVKDSMAQLLTLTGKDGNLTAEEAARIAQTLAGAATRQIFTVEGAPKAKTVALGGGTSVAVGGGKSGK